MRYDSISLRHSILYKEMFLCKTFVIDQLTAMTDRITVYGTYAARMYKV